MATVRLTDVSTNRYDTDFGTCDLCMSTGEAEEDTFTVETSDGGREYVEAFYWDWGDLRRVYIDNIPKFMVWVNEQKFEVDDISEVDYSWLSAKADEFYDVENA